MNQKELLKLRYTIMHRVTEYMYRDVMERKKEVIDNILRANNLAHDVECDSFFYDGKKWPENLGHYRCTFNLEPALVPEMESFLAWYKPIWEKEFPLVEAFVRKILNYSDDVAVSVSMFPSALRGVLSTVVNADGITFTSLSMSEVAEKVGVGEKNVRAMSFRLMANLVGA